MRLFCLILLFSLPLAVRADQLVTLHDEQQAIRYCAGGGVVWMDMTSGHYVYKGSKFYAKGQNAAFVCEVEAIRAGAAPARRQ